MNNVVIIGASGHGKVVADIIEKSGDTVVGFLDDNESLGKEFFGYSVLGVVKEYSKFLEYSFIIAIGNAKIRERIYANIQGVQWYTAIHPSAVIGKNVCIGEGTVVMAGAVINADTRIGVCGIINTCASVDHDNVLGDFVHVSVGSHLAGTVHVGNRTWIGIGAVVSNNVEICDDCMIGAGAVVVKDIAEAGTYVGVPAERVEYQEVES